MSITCFIDYYFSLSLIILKGLTVFFCFFVAQASGNMVSMGNTLFIYEKEDFT